MIKLTKEGAENLKRRLNNPTKEEIEATKQFFKETISDTDYAEKLKNHLIKENIINP